MLSEGQQQILIYEADNGQVQVTLNQDTLWLSQREIATAFGTVVPAINKLVSYILNAKEPW